MVEDSRLDRELLALLLKTGNYEVRCADSLNGALTEIKSHIPDLIVLDEQLPDGLSSLHLDKFRTLAPTCPIIFVSGQLDLPTALSISQRGVAAIFNKPVNPKALMAKIIELLEQRTAQRSGESLAADSDENPSRPTPPPATDSNPPTLPYRGIAFPGNSARHSQLSRQLSKVRDFRSTLLMVCREGGAFIPTVRDLQANSDLRTSAFYLFEPAQFTRTAVSRQLARLENETETATLVLNRIDRYESEQCALLIDILDFQAEFTRYAGRLRLVLNALPSLLEHSLPTALPIELIERIATLTVEIPSLDELREDLSLIARAIITETGAPAPRFTPEAIHWLETQPWPGDYGQFRRVLLLAHAANTSLNVEILQSAYEMEASVPEIVEGAYQTEFAAAQDLPTPPTPPNEAPANPPPPPPATAPIPETTPAAAKPPPTKRRPKVGNYDFATRLQASLDTPADAPPPVMPAHPRFSAAKS